MTTHQEIKSEIDARDGSFEECQKFGEELLEKEHRASDEIAARLKELVDTRNTMVDKWQEKWEWLELSRQLTFLLEIPFIYIFPSIGIDSRALGP